MNNTTDREKYVHLLDQLAWIRGTYGAINARQDPYDPRVAEILDLLDRAVDGQDIRLIR